MRSLEAKTVAENDEQAKSFDLLIDYYKNGDIYKWDDYCVQWLNTKTDIDWINGFRAGNKKELYCLCCRLGTFTLFELEYCPCSKKGCSKVRFMICNMGFEL